MLKIFKIKIWLILTLGNVGCSPWGRSESDTTEQLNWTELNWTLAQWVKNLPAMQEI